MDPTKMAVGMALIVLSQAVQAAQCTAEVRRGPCCKPPQAFLVSLATDVSVPSETLHSQKIGSRTCCQAISCRQVLGGVATRTATLSDCSDLHLRRPRIVRRSSAALTSD